MSKFKYSGLEDMKMIEVRNSGILLIVPLMITFVLFCHFTYGKVIYVDDDAAGANDGSGWNDAYNYLQDALTDANMTEKPVEILVAQGVYTPDRGAEFTRGDNGARFQLLNGVTVLGGFAGSGHIEPDARNIGAYQTILNGDLAGDDVMVTNIEDLSGEPTRAENSYSIVDSSDTDETAVLDGFTITAGSMGIRNFYGNSTIINCTFTNSRTGIRNWQSSSTIINCTFEGHWLSAINQTGGKLTLTDSLFSNNSGNSVDCSSQTDVTIRNCIFIDNARREAVNCFGDILRVYNCEFRNNTGAGRAGISSRANTEFIVEDCTFAGNTGSAIDMHGEGRAVVSNCVFTGNKEGLGSNGIYSWNPYTTIRNCTFSGNLSDISSTGGSALSLIRGGKISNCIIWGNAWPLIDGREEEIFINYSNVQGGWPGEGNIDVDPNFVKVGCWDENGTPADTEDDFWVEGDYHLRSQAGHWDMQSQTWIQDDVTSPCIDAGDPNSPLGIEPFPNGGRLNMGAYGVSNEASKTYFGGAVCETIIAGDINGDCVVDFKDQAIMMSHWLMQGEDFVNKAPIVQIIEPKDGDRIAWRGPTLLRAEASDIDGQVDEVSFRLQYKRTDGSRTLGFSTNDGSDGWEKEITWPEDAEFGTWTIWAEAKDNEGLTGFSPEITITLYRP